MSKRATIDSSAHSLARDWRRVSTALVALAAFVWVWPTDLPGVGSFLVGAAFAVAGAVAFLRARYITSTRDLDNRYVSVFATVVVLGIGLVAVLEAVTAR